ncbi:STAS domain-containing protein [Actinomadura fulvescens]|uniref:STAS domain-containing protein n=1 Tax=Actinomadura fulvescens TaxID=46160 RepID=A0ABN3QZT7_9ACTN
MGPLESGTDQDDDLRVVAVGGVLDITRQGDFDEALATARLDADDLIVDMTDVTFIDTRCMAVLIRHWKRLTTDGHRLILVGATYKTTRALWVTGLDKHIPHTDTVDQARQTLAATDKHGTVTCSGTSDNGSA